MSESVPAADKDVPVHACPLDGSGGIMPCCGRLVFEVRSHRIAVDPALVTCMTGSDPRLTPKGGSDA